MSEIAMFGSVAKVNEYKRKNGIEITPDKPKPIETNVKGAFQIGKEDDGKDVVITDEEMKLLNKVILKSNPEEVYLQEDLDFYDSYYFNNGSKNIDEELLKEARGIRRLYKNHTKYMYACYIREKYLDMLEDVYGSSSTNAVMNIWQLPDDVFIPPQPMYSRNAPDYDKVMSGVISTETPVDPLTPEERNALLMSYANARGIDLDSVGIVSDITVDRVVESVLLANSSSSGKFSGPSVNVSDLDSLQRLIKSWHQKEDDKKQMGSRIPFPESDAGRRERFLSELAFYVIDHINDEDEKEDENELVYDEVTKHTMTRRDFNERNMIRMMSSEGGWDDVKLMQQLQVGSKIERTKLKNKASRRKKAKKKATSFMNDIMGGNSFDGDVVTPDELKRYLFDD